MPRKIKEKKEVISCFQCSHRITDKSNVLKNKNFIISKCPPNLNLHNKNIHKPFRLVNKKKSCLERKVYIFVVSWMRCNSSSHKVFFFFLIYVFQILFQLNFLISFCISLLSTNFYCFMNTYPCLCILLSWLIVN